VSLFSFRFFLLTANPTVLQQQITICPVIAIISALYSGAFTRRIKLRTNDYSVPWNEPVKS
jgi:hypothetical protein